MSDGLITAEPISVSRTIDRLAAAAIAAALLVFARVDHAKDAHEAGLQLRPTELLIFGHARGGTSSSSNAIKPAVKYRPADAGHSVEHGQNPQGIWSRSPETEQMMTEASAQQPFRRHLPRPTSPTLCGRR